MKNHAIPGAGLCLVPVLAHLLAAPTPAQAPQQTPRELTGYLPANTPLVVDLFDGAAVVQKALRLLEPLPREVPGAARLALAGLPLFTKATTGLDLRDLLTVLTPGQALFAMYPAGGGASKPFPVLLTRVEEAGEVERVLRRIGKSTGNDLHTDLSDGVLTVSNTRAHVRRVLEFRGLRKSGAATLLARDEYRRGRAAMKPGASLRFYVDMKAVRKALGAEYEKGRGYWDKLPAFPRFVVGPLVRNLDVSDRIDARLDVTEDGFRLHGQTDGDLSQDPLGVERLMAAKGKARPLVLEPAGTLARVSLDRDLSELLGHPDRWLGDDGALGVKSFLSVADQILGGASMLKDLLPDIEMPMDFFVTATTPDEDADLPRITLPAFTLVFGLKEGARMGEKLLQRALRTITALTNVQRVRKQQPRIDVRSGRRDGLKFLRVRFGDWTGLGDPPIECGTSPTLLFAHGHGILSSTVDGAVRMAAALKSRSDREITGDVVRLHGLAIADVLAKNSPVLTMNRVLTEGGTIKEAKTFLSALIGVVRVLQFDASVRPRTGATGFEFGLRRVSR